MQKLFSAYSGVGKRMALAAGFLVLLISLMSTYEVVMRYFLNAPTSWTYEVSRYLLLVLIWLGAAGTLQNDSHISVDFVLERLPSKIGQYIMSFGYAVALAYSLAVMRETWNFYVKAVENGWETLGNVPIPSSWLYMVVFVGSAFLCFAFAQKIVEALQEKKTEKIKIEI